VGLLGAPCRPGRPGSTSEVLHKGSIYPDLRSVRALMAKGPTGSSLGLPSSCGPFRPSLRSFCGPACQEQPGTAENERTRIPVFSRLSPAIAARCKVLILRLSSGRQVLVGFAKPLFGVLRSICGLNPRHVPACTGSLDGHRSVTDRSHDYEDTNRFRRCAAPPPQ
jgi:hypothetical protein